MTQTADTIPVTMTQEHIDHGVRKDCGACPVALAIADAGFFHVYVDHRWGCAFRKSRISEGGWFRLPDAVTAFMKRFDRGEHVTPITFTIDMGAMQVTPRELAA